jgi:hypothetical protein
MSINIEDAFEVTETGVVLSDDSGTRTLYLTAVSADPTGTDAPVNTWVFRQDTNTLYYKFGAGLNDWRQVRADDIAFDVAPLLTNSPDLTGLTQTKEVIDALARRNFGKLYASGGKDPNTSSGTGSPVVEAAATTAVNLTETITHSFRANWFFRMRNSKSNTDGLVTISIRTDANPGSAIDQQSSSGTTFNALGGNNGEQTGGSFEFQVNGPVNNLQVVATIQRTAGNGTASVNSVRLELWRI